MHVRTRDGVGLSCDRRLAVILVGGVGRCDRVLAIVVQSTGLTYHVNPPGHLLLRVSSKVVDSPGCLDIKHILKSHLATLESQARVNLEMDYIRTTSALLTGFWHPHLFTLVQINAPFQLLGRVVNIVLQHKLARHCSAP